MSKSSEDFALSFQCFVLFPGGEKTFNLEATYSSSSGSRSCTTHYLNSCSIKKLELPEGSAIVTSEQLACERPIVKELAIYCCEELD